MRWEDTGQKYPLDDPITLWTALRCLLQWTTIYHHTYQMQGDVVQHDRTDNFIDAACYFEDCGYESPYSACECRKAETERDSNPRALGENWCEFRSEPCCCQCSHQKLSLGTDIPNPAPKRHRNRETCYQERRAFH